MTPTPNQERDVAAKGGLKSVLLDRVMAFQHEGVVHKLREQGYTFDEALAIFEDTKRFLFLCGTNPTAGYAPSGRIDDGWHCFILHTKDYMDFCQRHFGQFIHHFPNKPNAPRSAGRSKATLSAAIKAFGRDGLSGNWSYGPMSPDNYSFTATDKCHSSSNVGDNCTNGCYGQ